MTELDWIMVGVIGFFLVAGAYLVGSLTLDRRVNHQLEALLDALDEMEEAENG